MKRNVPSPKFPIGVFVKAKNGAIRFVSNIKDEVFEDDGRVSKQPPSPSCHYENYRLFGCDDLLDIINAL